MKCGSIEEAMNMISVAKKYKLKIMLGCMVETSIGITAASCLASAVDKVDLDLVWDPPWDKSMMSEAAKLELNLWQNK